MWKSSTLPVLLACLLAAPPVLPAADKLDLVRVTPVPAGQPIPTQDFFRPRVLSQPVINRAGTHIAAVVTVEEDQHMLMVYDIAAGTTATLGGRKDRDIYNVNWLGNDRVLFQLASRKLFGLGVMAADIRHLGDAYPIQQYNSSHVVSIPLHDPLHPLVWNRHEMETERDAGVSALNSNFQGGKLADLTVAMNDLEYMDAYKRARDQNLRSTLRTYPTLPAREITYAYRADKAGELAYAFTSDRGELAMYRLADQAWLRCPVDLEGISIVGAANEPGQLFVQGPSIDGRPYALQLLDSATGKLGEPLLQDAAYDFNGWLYRNPGTGDVLGAIFEKAGPHVYWFNDQYRTLQKILDGMFPGQVVRIQGSDETHTIFLVATFSDRQPVAYHWVNLEKRTAGLFQNSTPWIDPARMRPKQIMQFKTRDGYKLDGYLTLPDGASKARPAPLVVLCHGGPWARDSWSFDGEVQFLAAHGYAVLQANYRGSTGSVGRFPDGDEYAFVKMHQDVTDATRLVVSSGLVDPRRVAIMGGSFGGYLAVSGVAHESDLYACAVTVAGVFDWTMQLQAEKYNQYDLPYYGRMVKKLGDPKVETAKYEAMSPLQYVANIRVPVFVAGGTEDQVVEIQQSKKLIGELDRHHVPYEKFIVGGEGHGMAYLKNEVELYDRILAFLDRNLAARP